MTSGAQSVALIPRLIQHASRTKAEGTLIIPQWASATFWPLIFPEGDQPAKFIVEGMRLPAVDWILVPGRSGKTLFVGPPNTPMLALRLAFGGPSQQDQV